MWCVLTPLLVRSWRPTFNLSLTFFALYVDKVFRAHFLKILCILTIFWLKYKVFTTHVIGLEKESTPSLNYFCTAEPWLDQKVSSPNRLILYSLWLTNEGLFLGVNKCHVLYHQLTLEQWEDVTQLSELCVNSVIITPYCRKVNRLM